MSKRKAEPIEAPLVNSRGALALYCDDARLEASGKVTLVGCYGDVLFVESFPTFLPQLCIHISTWTPTAELFRSLTYRVYHNDNVIYEDTVDLSEFDLKGAENAAIAEEETKGAVRRSQIRRIVRFMPLPFESEGSLRVRIQTEREVLPAGGLLIQIKPKAPTET